MIISHILLVPNEIISPLPTKSFCYTNESVIFKLEVSNPKTGVNWTINGQILDTYASRVKQQSLGQGHHQLIIKKCSEDVVGVVTAITKTNIEDEILTSQSILKIGKKIFSVRK